MQTHVKGIKKSDKKFESNQNKKKNFWKVNTFQRGKNEKF